MASIAMLNYQRVPSAVSWRFPTQTTWFPGISWLFFMDFIVFPPERSPELRCPHCHGWEIPELMEVCENCRRLQQFLILSKRMNHWGSKTSPSLRSVSQSPTSWRWNPHCLRKFTPPSCSYPTHSQNDDLHIPICDSHIQVDSQISSFDSHDWCLIPIWLVVLIILKNMKVNGKDYPIYSGK